ncbi:C45 family peptidase [Treponema sp. OttesenSCG-928-L16]|nr:C45 family peptidase [Treponema sp. OttesenSCG-928-L16]
MISIPVHTMELSGTSYEIGFRLGKMAGSVPPLKKLHTGGLEGFGKEQAADAAVLFRRWCPGLEEELIGFADALELPPEDIFYYGMTCLLPRCSQIAVLPGASAAGIPLVARNYEYSHEAEDFCLVRTSVKGKHTHLGTSVLFFGRDDGLNEKGLSVTMSSCGFPVGPLPFMRPPKIKGLQFWAVIRSLLENCRDVQEGLDHLEGMPIAYNINLMLADKAGHLALVETLDGKNAVKRLDPGSPEQLFWATNHAVLPELRALEPQAMVHSTKRYEWIAKELKGSGGITKDRLKEMLLSKYPDGLCCPYFEEYFGTTKSMIISPAEGTIELCWGGRKENGWKVYDIRRPLAEGQRQIEINPEKADPAEYQFQAL